MNGASSSEQRFFHSWIGGLVAGEMVARRLRRCSCQIEDEDDKVAAVHLGKGAATAQTWAEPPSTNSSTPVT